MKESTTYQATLEEGRLEGRLEEARDVLILLGEKKLGKPSSEIGAQLEAIAAVSTLHALIGRIQEVASWEELLQAPPKARTRRKKT